MQPIPPDAGLFGAWFWHEFRNCVIDFWAGGRPAMIQQFLQRTSSTYATRRKEQAEAEYWADALFDLQEWFRGKRAHWGIPPPREDQKVTSSTLGTVNAILTRHRMRPTYLEALQLDRDVFRGKTVLEIGSGPMAPILQFSDCERHCVDPLANCYLFAGWPLFALDAKFWNVRAESLPFPLGYFDAVIAVNSLDHVEDFEEVAREIQRVLRCGGELYIEVEYHEPTLTEPVALTDDRVCKAFSKLKMKRVINRTGRERAEAITKRFGLQPFAAHVNGLLSTWHGEKS